MPRSQPWIIAGAILAGSLIIAVGLFAGLRAPGGAMPVAVAGPAPLEPVRGQGAGGPGSPLAPPTPLDPLPAAPRAPGREPAGSFSYAELRQRASEEAAAALQADRWKYQERCWAPALQRHPGAEPMTFEYDVAFDAAGREIARGISSTGRSLRLNEPGAAERMADPTELARGEVHQCLNEIHDLPITVQSPGRNLGVTLSLRLP